jgi:sec-independent protein translocase protein TatB
MFDIAWSEFMLIGAVALVVIGPKDLPKALRTVGQAVGKVRRMAAEFQGQFNEAMREAELHDLKKQVEEVGGSVSNSMNTDFKPIEMPKPVETPAADTASTTAVAADAEAMKQAEAKLAELPLPELPAVEIPSAEIAPTAIAPADVTPPAAEEAPKPKRRRKVAAAEAELAEPVAEAAPPKAPRKRKPKVVEKVAESDDGSAT